MFMFITRPFPGFYAVEGMTESFTLVLLCSSLVLMFLLLRWFDTCNHWWCYVKEMGFGKLYCTNRANLMFFLD